MVIVRSGAFRTTRGQGIVEDGEALFTPDGVTQAVPMAGTRIITVQVWSAREKCVLTIVGDARAFGMRF